jgi:hypothetical protein
MNTLISIPTLASPDERAPICRQSLARGVFKLLAAAALAIGLASSGLAIEQPPEAAPQQRAWLLSHLVTDMQSVGSFTSDDVARMVTLVNSLADDQVNLLAQFYYFTRAKTEQDAQLFATQQTEGADALAQAKAQIADIAAQLQNQILGTYSDLSGINPGCQTLCQITYASLPGWCAYNQYAIPDWYYSDGRYVGPLYSAGYCGAYAVPVYRVFYNHASRYNWWTSRTYVHNNIVRIARAAHPAVIGRQIARPAARHAGTVLVPRHAAVTRLKTPSLVVKHAPTVAVRRSAAKVVHAHVQHVARAVSRPQHVAQARSGFARRR